MCSFIHPPQDNIMISFKILPEREDVMGYLDSVRDCFFSDEVFLEIEELLNGYFDIEGDDESPEVAVAVSSGCFLIRIYQDQNGYSFLCPIPISAGASIAGASEEVRKYAIKEELPLIFIDVYNDDIEEVCEPFRFTDVQPMDEDGEVLYVAPYTEVQYLEEPPVVEGEKIVLSALCEADIPEYARLCRHTDVNKLYGNDYRDDYGSDAPDTAFFFRADSEFYQGISITLAIRHEGDFAGEATLFAFDYVGGAKVAIRLLPEFWGKGIGSEALRMMLEVAREIDLKRVTTAVKKENRSSIKMTGKYMSYKCDEGDTSIFEVKF